MNKIKYCQWYAVTRFVLAASLCSLMAVEAQADKGQEGSEPMLPIVCRPVQELAVDDEVGPIVMTRMALPHILNLLQTFSGRTIIPGSGLPSLQLTFRTQDPLRRDEAILAIETLLRLNGIILIKGDAGFVEARPLSQALTSGPVLLDAERPGEIEGQQIYGRVFDLKHMATRDVFPQVRGMLSPGGLSSIANFPLRDAIMVFDTRRNLETIARVVEMLDQPVDRQADVFVVPAQNSTVQNLHQALQHAQRHQANPALNRASFQINRQANHLVVVAPRENRAYIEELAALLDADIAPMTTSRVIPVQYGNIRSLYNIMNGIVRHQQRTWQRSGIRSHEPFRGEADVRGGDGVSTDGVTAAPEGEGVTIAVPEPVSAGEVVAELQQTAQDLQFSPYMSIWLDLANNAIVAYGTHADIARAEALIADLDRETAPLLISEVIRLNHAFAPTIGNLISRMVQTQRNIFRQEQLGRTDSRRPAAEMHGADVAAEAEAAFDFSPFMTIFTEQSGNSLIVYGTRADLDKIKPLIEQLDREYAPVTSGKTITIQHTQSSSVAATLQRIISLQQLAFRRQGIRADVTRSQDRIDGQMAADADSSFEFTPYALVHADRTTNTIFLYGTLQDLMRMEALVAELDRETAPITRSQMFYLRHAGADALSRLLSSLVWSQRRTFQQLGLRHTTDTDEQSAESQVEQEMGLAFSDFAVVIADRRSNGILVYGTDGDIRRIAQVIEKADVAVEPITMSRIIPLRHADANHVSRVLQIIITGQRRALQQYGSEGLDTRTGVEREPLRSLAEGDPALQFSPFLSIVPDARNNALIVYGTHADVEHVNRLAAEIDVEVAPLTVSEVFILQHAQASQVAGMLMGIINNQRRAMALVQSQFRAVQFRTRQDAEEQDGTAMDMLFDPGKAMQFSPYVSVVANPRNNSLLGYGTAADMEQLRQLVASTDIEVAPRTQSRVFVIRHGDANDILRTLTPLIQAQQRVREREATLRRFFGQQRDADENRGDIDAEVEGAGSSFDTLDYPGVDLDRDLQFSPYITLTADTRANTVIAYGTAFDLEQVDYLVGQIDRVLPQVRIEVVIAEVSLSEGQVSGLNSFGFSYDNPFDFQAGGGIIAMGQGGIAAAAGGPGANGNDAPASGAGSAQSFVGRGGLIATGPQLDSSGAALDMGITVDPFSMRTVFRVAREDRNVRILSAPSITTTHNRPAHINVGEARPIITSSTATLDRSLATRSEIEYRDIGIQLTVRPLISEHGVIQLDIEQVVETVVDTQTIDNNIQPIIGTRRANSFVSVHDQQILVMGGLQSVETTLSEGRVFLLGDIPVLGYLFRPRRRISTVRELIIFIRPELVQSRPIQEAFHADPAQRRTAEAEVLRYYESGTFETDPRGMRQPERTRFQRLFGLGKENDDSATAGNGAELSESPKGDEHLPITSEEEE